MKKLSIILFALIGLTWLFPQGTVHAQADEYYTVSDDVYYGMSAEMEYIEPGQYHYWTLDADQNDIIKMFARGFDGVQLQLVLYLPSGEQIGQYMTTSDDLHVDDLHLPVSGAYTIQIQNVSSVHAPYAFSVTREAIGVPVSSDESSENSDDGGNVDSDGNTSANTGSVVTLSQQPQGALAWQPFERGVMMWFSGTNQIWVFFDTGNGAGYVRYYGDTFSGTNYEGWSENCSISPIRGFGRVYFENELYNDIGCAMSQEVGYQGANTPPSSGRLQVDGPGNTLYRVNRNNHTWVTVNAG